MLSKLPVKLSSFHYLALYIEFKSVEIIERRKKENYLELTVMLENAWKVSR